MLLPSSKVVVLVTVATTGSPPAGEDDEIGVFCFFCGEYDVLCFFAVINDAGDYPILSAYRACRDARRRVETGVSPTPKGGGGGHPPHIRACTRNRFFAYQPQVTRRREPPPIPSAYSAALAAILMPARMTRLGCFFFFCNNIERSILRVSSLIRALRARFARA